VNVKTLYHNKKPDTTKKIREEFTLKNATVFGRYNLLNDFIKAKLKENSCTALILCHKSPAISKTHRYT